MNVLITLDAAGADTNNFQLLSDADGYTTPFETGVTKASLLAGYTSTVVPEAATIVRVQSTGICTNFLDLSIDLLECTLTTGTAVEV